MQWIKYILATVVLSMSLITGASEPGKVNINTASAEQLSTLDGIGKSKAEAIVLYRQQVNGFKSVDELANVKGIGDSTLQKNKDRITLK